MPGLELENLEARISNINDIVMSQAFSAEMGRFIDPKSRAHLRS